MTGQAIVKGSFKPVNDKQKRFLESTKKYLMLSGAVAAGKSFIGCLKGLMLNLQYPGNRGLICRKEARSLTHSTIKTLLAMLPEDMIIEYNQQKGEIVHATGVPGVYSSIVFSGLDKKADQSYPTKIGSTEYGWIFIDEGTEVEEGDWNMLSTRLRFRIPRYSKESNDLIPRPMFTATNPDGPNHFLYKFFFESDHDDREVFLTTPYDNPTLPPDYLSSLEDSLTGVARERLLEGKWVQAEGIIYDGFSFQKHVVDPSVLLPIKDYKEVVFGADSNYPLPRACVLLGFRGDGTVDVIDEYYQEGSHVEQMIEWLQDWQQQRGGSLYGYHDPSDPVAIDKIKRTPFLHCSKAKNAVIPGISEVGKHFSTDLIRINKNCKALIRELQVYRWKNEKEGEIPLKEDDHACDALRYGLYSHRFGKYKVVSLQDRKGVLF